MNHRDHYRQHEAPRRSYPRGSLARIVGDSTDAEFVRRQAAAAWHQRRGLWLSEDDLKALPMDVRMLIEIQGRRIYGPRQQSGG